MTFADRLTAARVSRPHRDVPVILDAAISEERARLEAELEAADDDPRMGAKTPAETIQEQIDALDDTTESVETIRVMRLPGRDWTVLTSSRPPRPNVAIDTIYGYNIDAVIEAAIRYRDPRTDATYAFRLEDGQPVEVTDDEWTDLFELISGREFSLLRDAVYEINEYEPQARLNALVKGSGAATRSDEK